MLERFSRRRKVLIALALGTIALFSLPDAVSEKIKLNAAGVLTPLREAAGMIERWFTRTAPDPALAAQLHFLERRLAAAELKNKQLQAQLGALQALESFDLETGFDVIGADVVVPTDSSPWRSSLVIAKGSTHGVRKGQIVVYQQYLVGRIHDVGLFSSRVILATDSAFKIGAGVVPLEPDGVSQVGIAQGSPSSKIVLRWISQFDSIRQGQFVATTVDPVAGVPKGLILGRVLSLDRTRGPYPDVVIEPSIRGSALDFVMILSPKEPK